MMRAQGGNVITVTDATCKVQTYNSGEDLPPEMSALYGEVREQDGSK